MVIYHVYLRGIISVREERLWLLFIVVQELLKADLADIELKKVIKNRYPWGEYRSKKYEGEIERISLLSRFIISGNCEQSVYKI